MPFVVEKYTDIALVRIYKLPEIMAFALKEKILVIFKIMYRYN